MKFVTLTVAAVFLATGASAFLKIETVPDRAVWKYNGHSFLLQTKTKKLNKADIALAKSVCKGAKMIQRNPTIYGVSEYLFVC